MKCIALSRCHRDNARIAYTTRKWKLSKNWHQERVAFDCFQILGYLKIYTDRCNKQKLCASILTLVKLKTSAVLHGLLYEAGARQTFNARIGPKIQTCGLFIRSEYNYLAASPACVVGEAAKPEITCHFNARNSKTAANFFPFPFETES